MSIYGITNIDYETKKIYFFLNRCLIRRPWKMSDFSGALFSRGAPEITLSRFREYKDQLFNTWWSIFLCEYNSKTDSPIVIKRHLWTIFSKFSEGQKSGAKWVDGAKWVGAKWVDALYTVLVGHRVQKKY